MYRNVQFKVTWKDVTLLSFTETVFRPTSWSALQALIKNRQIPVYKEDESERDYAKRVPGPFKRYKWLAGASCTTGDLRYKNAAGEEITVTDDAGVEAWGSFTLVAPMMLDNPTTTLQSRIMRGT